MSDDEALGRAVYDHDNDELRPSGRRRRQVADWGVGEELFDHMPGPRFERRQSGHEIPRGGAADGRRTVVIGDEDAEPPLEEARRDEPEAFASRDEAMRARATDHASWAGDEPARRTVKISGRPGAYAAPRPARRRPPRTVGERVGARPDRIAAWAFALGMLLILIAIVTAQI
jgi:hypothetical protein